MVAIVHDDVGDGPLDVDPGAVPIYEAAGWRLLAPPEGHEPAAAPEPPWWPEEPPRVDLVHPADGLEVSVDPGAVAHLRPAGWLTASEHQANIKAAEAAAEAARAPTSRRRRTTGDGDQGRPQDGDDPDEGTAGTAEADTKED